MKFSAIKWLYTYRFLDDFILIYPLYQLMFVAHGLDLVQISWLFVIWSATTIFIEVPTGVLADRYSRKNLLALGQAIRAVGFAMWLLVPNFWGYAIGFILWSIGASFHSGTFEALIYDELKLVGLEKTYVKVKGRAESLGLTGNLISTILAAAAIVLGFDWLLIFSVAAVILAAIVAYGIPEAPREQATGETGYFADLRAGIGEALHNRVLLRIILLGSFIGALFGSLEEYTPVFFQAAGASLQAVPLLDALVISGMVLGGIVAHRFEKLRTRSFMLILALSGLCLVIASGLPGPAGIAVLIAFFIIIKLLETIYDGKLQHSIRSQLRATITSVGGFAVEIFSIAAFLIFGYVAGSYGTLAAFGVFGVATIVVALVYVVVAPRVFAAG